MWITSIYNTEGKTIANYIIVDPENFVSHIQKISAALGFCFELC